MTFNLLKYQSTSCPRTSNTKILYWWSFFSKRKRIINVGIISEREINLDEQDSIFHNSTLTSPNTIREIPKKSYVDSLHENCRNRRDLSSVSNDHDISFDNHNLTTLGSITVNRDQISYNEKANRNFVEDSVGECTKFGFKQTVENRLTVSVDNYVYIPAKYDKTQITDITTKKYPNASKDLLQNWNKKCEHEN